MNRKMKFASLFYDRNEDSLRTSLQNYFRMAEQKRAKNNKVIKEKARICMLPHAGHIYSGEVAAATLAEINLPKKCIILCPNHTGYGKDFAIWDKGSFETPLGSMEIDQNTAKKILENKVFSADYKAHEQEHSIEVILPFLQYHGDCIKIIPICLRSLEHLESVAQTILSCMQEDEDLGLIISSDMNHFASEQENRRKDFLAIEALQNLDEQALLEIVKREDISMCGVLGAYVAILVAKGLGYTKSNLVEYDTSATASLDFTRVVGYAGMYIN